MDKKIILINGEELEKVSGGSWGKNVAIVSIGVGISFLIGSVGTHMSDIIRVVDKAVNE